MATFTEVLQFAVQQHRTNNLLEAEHLYRQLLEQQPNHPDVLHGLSTLSQQKGEYQQAENLLNLILSVHPKSVRGWFSLGNLWQVQGKLPEAIQAYQKVLSLEPQLVPAYNNLGYTLQLQDKWSEAIACYEKALELEPNCTEADVNLANALHTQGKLPTEKQVHYAAINNDLGVTQKKAGDLKTAIAYYRQAIALQPDLGIAHYNLGIALQEQGNLEAAMLCYQKVLEIEPRDAGVYQQLAGNKLNRIYKKQNKIKGKNDRELLRIAFVNQYCDIILPPFQNSVGACTYGIVRPLAESSHVNVYALQHGQKLKGNYYNQGVNYKFVSLLAIDLWLFKLFHKYENFFKLFNRGMATPPSFSKWVYPMYGQEVAMNISLQPCDVIHFQHTSQYIPVVRSLNPKAKIVLTLHSELFSQHNRKVFEKRLRYVDYVTCVSDYITEKTRRDFPKIADRCQTIYNGIESVEFVNNRKNYSEARQRKVKRIMYAGAVSPQKGIHILLEALQIVVKSYPDVHLEVIGPQGTVPAQECFPLNDKALVECLKPFYAKQYISELLKMISPDIVGKVSFAGMIPRSQLIDRFFEADIFVFPPIWDEGFGIPPVEAMAAGTPVVATRSGAVLETVQDGKTGFLVDKNNAPALADAILKLLGNDALRESMGRAGRQRAFEYFTWEQAADQTLQLYETLCN
ncbi:MAG: glycosyltransferase [Trichodesmium sp. MO_231.B1]|nr:glycosyltransferase [Trichodesmium sp. MO_231.B1]